MAQTDTRTLSEKRRDAVLVRHAKHDPKQTMKAVRAGYVRQILRELDPRLAQAFETALTAQGACND